MEIVFPGGARVDAVMGNMVIETNQDGSAPAPFGLFLASIGTCAGIYVPPDFPEKYHAALIRAADQCAVKKHMEQQPTFNVQTRVEEELAPVA